MRNLATGIGILIVGAVAFIGTKTLTGSLTDTHADAQLRPKIVGIAAASVPPPPEWSHKKHSDPRNGSTGSGGGSNTNSSGLSDVEYEAQLEEEPEPEEPQPDPPAPKPEPPETPSGNTGGGWEEGGSAGG